MAGSQSKLHNARSQALKASYSVWKEELRADQLNHETMVRGCLAEAGKRRNELLRTLEAMGFSQCCALILSFSLEILVSPIGVSSPQALAP